MEGENSEQQLENEPTGDKEMPNREEEAEEAEEEEEEDESSSDSESESDPDEDESDDDGLEKVLNYISSKKREKKLLNFEEQFDDRGKIYDFPKDPENWDEKDLKELWADPLPWSQRPGWDPKQHYSDDEGYNEYSDYSSDSSSEEELDDLPVAPFYLPYRKLYPVVPNNHFDIRTPKDVIEELDRTEEFLRWVSFIFPDGSSYEGTVWDDLAHGKGVYVAEQGLVRYEGEWLQNNMDGHGVVEVEIPRIEPVPGSKLEKKMRAKGKIIQRDFMSPEDKEWLEMDIEDSIKLTGDMREIPFYERNSWIKVYGSKPEKGRYRYAGQWKHARMHGCGVYEVNERVYSGRFYFGEYLDEDYGCDADISAMHAALADVAAAKARMFVNKPDGMVREQWGPYNDPQHPYLYEEDDVWMAPGFINQFHEVPDYWKTYVHEVDEEREMWLNSFYKAPLRLPMPAELEYWWANEEPTEFDVVHGEPEPDPEDPSQLIYRDEPYIVHKPSGRLIGIEDDEEHGVRLYWKSSEEEEDEDPDERDYLPLGFDEFYGREVRVEKESPPNRLLTSIENKLKPLFKRLEKWTEEKMKESELKIDVLKAEIEYKEAELSLKEVIEDMDEELKRMQKEEEKKVALGLQEEEDTLLPKQVEEVEKTEVKDEEEDEEDITDSSFGSVEVQDLTRKDEKGEGTGKSPFAASSLSFAASSIVSVVPPLLQQYFCGWKKSKLKTDIPPPSPLSKSCFNNLPLGGGQTSNSVAFCRTSCKNLSFRSIGGFRHQQVVPITKLRPRRNSPKQKEQSFKEQSFNILSLHSPMQIQ